MASNTIEKGGLSFDGTKINIFEREGAVKEDGNWALGLYIDDGALFDSPPDPVSGKLNELIMEDEAGGNADQIDHVRVHPEVAVKLFCEGLITRAHIFSAEADSEKICFPRVTFEGNNGTYQLDVIAHRHTRQKYATCDHEGNVL